MAMVPTPARQCSVEAPHELTETIKVDMNIETVAQLLALKSTELLQLQRTHDEYIKSSCEYERELEMELERFEVKTHQIEAMALQLERDKTSVDTKSKELNDALQCAQCREHVLQTQVRDMKWQIQRLEQANDELETSARVAQATIEDLRHKCETLQEQHVFLMHEKEELLLSTKVAEIYPVSMATLRRANEGISRNSSSQYSDLMQEEPTRNFKRRKGRRPEILETCLHLTCRNCRANKRHAPKDEKRSVSGFLKNLWRFLSGSER